MTLSDFCDLVWMELWDDCPAMGDQVKYRESLMAIFYEGREIRHEPRGRSAKAPMKPDLSRPLPSEAVKAMQEMRAKFAKGATGTE